MEREKCTNLIISKLELYNEDKENVKIISKKIEEGIFDFAKNNINTYRQQSRIIIANISHTPNAAQVRKKIFEGIWDAYTVGQMTTEELFPELKEKEKEDMKKEDEIKESFKRMQMSRNSIYTCGRCKKNRVEYYQSQRRSADEGMSIMCTCLTCGHRWKFS